MDSNRTTQVRLFISYKPEDFQVAHQIADVMRFIGRDRLSVSTCEDPPRGMPFFVLRLPELAQADMLLLLYTDPQQDWNLCLYESGFFSGKHFPDHYKRLIVLHSEDVSIPSPLDQFDKVAVSQTHRSDLNRFIRGLFAEPVRDGLEPVYPEIMSDGSKVFRTQLEDTIVNAVSGPQETRVFVKEFSIEVPEESLRATRGAKTNDMPSDAHVFADRTSFELFGLNESPSGYAWKDFYQDMDRTSSNTQEWADALVLSCGTSRSHKGTCPPRGCRCIGPPAMARQVVIVPQFDPFAGRKKLLSFRVLFIDLPSETTEEEGGATTSLAQVLTLGRMLRSGVLFPFRDRLHSLESESRLRPNQVIASKTLVDEYTQFLDKIATVYVEARNRGYQRSEMLHYFEGNGSRDNLEGLIKRWDILFAGSKDLLDKLKNGQAKIAALHQIVNEAIDVNKQYMILFAQRYKEGIEQW